jgi:hypothetical protein
MKRGTYAMHGSAFCLEKVRVENMIESNKMIRVSKVILRENPLSRMA